MSMIISKELKDVWSKFVNYFLDFNHVLNVETWIGDGFNC